MSITTDRKYNFSAAENETFAWKNYDGDNDGHLFHKPSGRTIYQMCWINDRGYMGDKVEDPIREQASNFWAELKRLQAAKPERKPEPETEAEPEHGKNGYCRKCHSYCYGDCQSN